MQSTVAVDTSVVVAGLLAWHQHHEPARASLEKAMEDGPLVLPVPALVESYAVMTRLPAPHRLSPADAHALLYDNFAETARVESLAGHECWDTLKEIAAQTIGGGRTYDAQILAVALKLGANALLTLNTADFAALAKDEIEIRSPLALSPGST